jgi:hypothetical protein
MQSLPVNNTRKPPLYCIDTLIRRHQSRKRLSEGLRIQALHKAWTQEVEPNSSHAVNRQLSVENDHSGFAFREKLVRDGSNELEPFLIQYTKYVCDLSNNNAVTEKNFSNCVRRPVLPSNTSINENRYFVENWSQKKVPANQDKEFIDDHRCLALADKPKFKRSYDLKSNISGF